MRKNEMSRNRTIDKHEVYYNKIIQEISSSKRKVANARLRKGLYKKFFSEYCVLLEYCKIKYDKKPNVKFKWVDIQNKSLNYDGEIYINNILAERVEITCPLLSKKDNDNAQELNKHGYTHVEVGNLSQTLNVIKNKIIDITLKKNNNMHYDNMITLVVYLNDDIHFFDGVDICSDKLQEIKNNLIEETYQFKNVYILESINNKCKLVKIK